MKGMTDMDDTSDRSDWHRPGDEMTGKATSCPKCNLKFRSMLFQFCQHKNCPVREFEQRSKLSESVK